ncbi:MAG: BON domain-containing protein [Xanthomonadaceae bacterium]|nr:BON domain-containing protein [Xanthomonadaceae bacterium]MDE1961751.1 BON domain-containing protein [Xanthomonadaceae bacterium]MDE2084318.1 BON domain-containing protein [Xanthomonadaceae bacterium]MDE2257843.1 BON domain-containing protein [Xanthomonadaceae bacterium]
MYRTVFLLALAPLLHGCIAVVAGGAIAGAHAVHDRRALGTVLSDRNIQLSAIDAINKHRELTQDDNNVKVVVYNGVMLLCGQVRSEELKQLAQSSAAGFDGVVRLVNQIEVTDEPEGFWRRRADNATTARIKTGLLDITSLPGFDPTRINVTTSHHVVYLMGLVKHDEAEAATEVARNTDGVVKVVKLFEYTD